jgi:hypothetical protein
MFLQSKYGGFMAAGLLCKLGMSINLLIRSYLGHILTEKEQRLNSTEENPEKNMSFTNTRRTINCINSHWF